MVFSMNTGQVGDKSSRRHPTRRQVESATSNSATIAVNSATTSVKSATFANRLGDNFGHIGDTFCLNPFSIIVADLTNAFVADLTAVVAELTAVVAELDVADSTRRRDGCRRLDLSPT